MTYQNLVPARTSARILVDIAEPALLALLSETLLGLIVKTFDDNQFVEQVRVWPSICVGENAEPAQLPDPFETVIVPLSRLGTDQGLSGASVFIAYFLDPEQTYLPSVPLVVKIDKHYRLQRELTAALQWPQHQEIYRRPFAYPFYLSDGSGEESAVLIAPFSSQFEVDTNASLQVGIHDLWKMLHEQSEANEGSDLSQKIRDANNALYFAMRNIHRNGRFQLPRKDLSYEAEYRLYLRKLKWDSPDQIPCVLFGTQDRTNLLGFEWPNPCKVIDNIFRRNIFQGAIGPVHGDLHPKNVVIDSENLVSVIDFAWARPDGHVIVDYVLMEINYRAMTCPSQVSIKDLLLMARWLDTDEKICSDNSINSIVVDRCELIAEGLRKNLEMEGMIHDWDSEYLAPMLLVAFGLLKHLDRARNQISLLVTVLCLADRLDEYFKEE